MHGLVLAERQSLQVRRAGFEGWRLASGHDRASKSWRASNRRTVGLNEIVVGVGTRTVLIRRVSGAVTPTSGQAAIRLAMGVLGAARRLPQARIKRAKVCWRLRRLNAGRSATRREGFSTGERSLSLEQDVLSYSTHLAILLMVQLLQRLSCRSDRPVCDLDRTHLWHAVPLASWIGSCNVN